MADFSKITRKNDSFRAGYTAWWLHLHLYPEPDMTKVVLTFGLISGLIISVLMGGSLLLANRIGPGHSMALGYTIMVASFMLIYFGIQSYRDNNLDGTISFG